MAYYQETLASIRVGDWVAAAELIACHFHGNLSEMGSKEQTVILQAITKQLMLSGVVMKQVGFPSPERPIEARFAKEIYEETCFCLGFDDNLNKL